MMFNPSPNQSNGQSSSQSSIQEPAQRALLDLDIKEHRYIPLEQVLDACKLSIQPGEIVSLIGPSGCGKSTLLKIAAGLLDPSDGHVQNHAKETAILFQDHRLLPWKKLAENMGFGFMGRSVAPEIQTARLEKAAHLMGFTKADMEKYPAELSGGMRQRAAIARALVIEPDLLFLDEPFSSLDVGRRRDMYRLLLGEVSERGCAVLMVTHDVFEALSLSDRVLVMAPDPGRLIRQVPVGLPRSERTRQMIAGLEADLLSDQAVADLFRMQDWERIL